MVFLIPQVTKNVNKIVIGTVCKSNSRQVCHPVPYEDWKNGDHQDGEPKQVCGDRAEQVSSSCCYKECT